LNKANKSSSLHPFNSPGKEKGGGKVGGRERKRRRGEKKGGLQCLRQENTELVEATGRFQEEGGGGTEGKLIVRGRSNFRVWKCGGNEISCEEKEGKRGVPKKREGGKGS